MEAITVDANALHFQQTMIRITTRVELEKESTIRFHETARCGSETKRDTESKE